MPSIPSTGAGIKKTLLNWLFTRKASFSFALILVFLLPAFLNTQVANSDQEKIYSPESRLYNSQTVAILSPKFPPDPKGPVGGPDDIHVEDEALVPNISPIADTDTKKISSASPDDISVYTVREGDTLGEIAEMFDISPNTIRWANDIDLKGSVKPGQELIILPISGIKHKVVKGETIATIAKKYKGDAREISLFNGIEESEGLVIGTEIIIPNGESAETTSAKKTPSIKGGKSTEVPNGYYGKPTMGVKTQGQHDRWAIDIGAKTGTAVWAMADGTATVVKSGGYGGGYGSYIVISHPNGTQTLYAHLSSISIKQGQAVKRGDVIGGVGSTGRSTGPHLHIEIRPGKTGINGIAILEKMY